MKNLITIVAFIVALMAPVTAHAQTTDGEAQMFVDMDRQQAVVVTITDIGELLPGASNAALFNLTVDDAFVEQYMSGFMVMESEQLGAVALNDIGNPDAAKMFLLIDKDTADSVIMIAAMNGNDMLLVGFIGFEEDADFELAEQVTKAVVTDGTGGLDDVDGFDRFVKMDA